jgi:uncharacterized membrane protein HdeD (DUF308 family)
MDDQNNFYQDNTQGVQPSYQTPEPPEKRTNVLAIVSLILGILSIPACCTCFIAIILGVGGIICSVLSKREGKSGLATAGLICSIIGIVLGSIYFILVLMGVMAGEAYGIDYSYFDYL